VVGLISTARYTPISEVNPRLSKRFAAIVERAMSLDPKNRFEDMRAMGRQLLLLAGQRTRITWGLTFGQENRGPLSLATLDRASVPAPAPTPAPQRRRATLVLAGGVALLSAGITSVFLSVGRESEPVAEQVHTVDAPRPEVTMVMASSPSSAERVVGEPRVAGEPAPEPPAQPPPAAESEAAGRLAVTASVRSYAEEPSAGMSKRVAAAMNEAPADRRRQVVRRPPPRPRAKSVQEEVADWEATYTSKAASPKPAFEIGSNNAPILD